MNKPEIPSKHILMVAADAQLSQSAARYLLAQGHQMTVWFCGVNAPTAFLQSLNTESRERCHVECCGDGNLEAMTGAFIQAETRKPVDVVIYGHVELDEFALLGTDELMDSVERVLIQVHRVNRLVIPAMMKRGYGHLVFLVMANQVRSAGYPTSPIQTGAKLALMRTLARELSGFRIAVNALSFGYYAREEDTRNKKQMQEELSVFAHRLQVLPLNELMELIQVLFSFPSSVLSGQIMHAGTGLDMPM